MIEIHAPTSVALVCKLDAESLSQSLLNKIGLTDFAGARIC